MSGAPAARQQYHKGIIAPPAFESSPGIVTGGRAHRGRGAQLVGGARGHSMSRGYTPEPAVGGKRAWQRRSAQAGQQRRDRHRDWYKPEHGPARQGEHEPPNQYRPHAARGKGRQKGGNELCYQRPTHVGFGRQSKAIGRGKVGRRPAGSVNDMGSKGRGARRMAGGASRKAGSMMRGGADEVVQGGSEPAPGPQGSTPSSASDISSSRGALGLGENMMQMRRINPRPQRYGGPLVPPMRLMVDKIPVEGQ